MFIEASTRVKSAPFIVYDIGLTAEERTLLKRYGHCRVLDFPFDKLPKFFTTLKCFSWKVFIIAAHYEQADVLIWADASVRVRNTTQLIHLIERARTRGVQQRFFEDMLPLPIHTDPEMFEYFGDSPCAYMPYRMCEGSFGIYHKEELIRRAVIHPWVACAGREACMCRTNWAERLGCRRPDRKPPADIGYCNRFDQSAISIILAKLFREKYYHFAVDIDCVKVWRGDGQDYFVNLESKEKTIRYSNPNGQFLKT